MPRARLSHSPKFLTAAGLARLRQTLLLSALLALAFWLTPHSIAQRQEVFRLTATAESVNVCPGKPAEVGLTLTVPERGSFGYRWQAEAGRIKGDGARVVWDLWGVQPGVYTAGVTITLDSVVAASQSTTRRVKVVVNECGEAPPPSCPDIKLDCPQSVTEGEPAVLMASVAGGGPRQPLRVPYAWTAPADGAVDLQGRRIRVETKGLGGQFINGRFEARGYGLPCAATCRTFVNPTPTPTPSPDPVDPVVATSPTPPASPTPNASPTSTPSADASPSASGAATPVITPQHDDAGSGYFAWLYWAVPLLITLAFILWALFGGRSKTTGKISFGGGRDKVWDWVSGRSGRTEGLPRPEQRPEEPGGQTKEAVEADAGGVLTGGTAGATDELQCTVYAPFEAAPGDGFLVQAFAHLAEQAPRLAGLAREAQQNAERRGARGLGAVARGQELGFHLQMPGLEVDEPSQSIIWKGEIETVQFGVNVPEDFRPRPVNCKLTVSSLSVPLGHIRFTFNVNAAPRPAPDAPPLRPHDDFKRYRQAFISYASEDRVEVLRCVQMLTLLKIDCFQDVLSLQPGQRWREGLSRNIAVSDVLFLFWSRAASRSEWVENEVRYALSLKAGDDERPPEIVPVILQGPPEVPPPDYLPELHFNDPFAYFIKAAAAMKQPAKDR